MARPRRPLIGGDGAQWPEVRCLVCRPSSLMIGWGQRCLAGLQHDWSRPCLPWSGSESELIPRASAAAHGLASRSGARGRRAAQSIASRGIAWNGIAWLLGLGLGRQGGRLQWPW